jgi:hypothetical protein
MIWLEAKPFTWTADLDKIIAAVKRGSNRVKIGPSCSFVLCPKRCGDLISA